MRYLNRLWELNPWLGGGCRGICGKLDGTYRRGRVELMAKLKEGSGKLLKRSPTFMVETSAPVRNQTK